MRIDAIWNELHGELADALPSSWISRFALPDPANPILVAIEVSTGRRALLLPLSSEAVPPRREWPRCQGLEIFTVLIGGVVHLGVRLTDSHYEDVFSALAEDVAPRVLKMPTDREAALSLLDRLRRWQKFLSARSVDMSVQAQRGLYGELHVLRNWMIPALGIAAALRSWRAPRASHQDFQLPTGAIEVKTTTAKQPQTINITSERQLDDTGIRALFLFVVVLDEREFEDERKSGKTLAEIVLDIRRRLSESPELKDEFDDKLLEVGYLDADAARYANRHYSLRSERVFRVGNGFPRLLERDLPSGIGSVNYELSIAACTSFAVQPADMISIIQKPS